MEEWKKAERNNLFYKETIELFFSQRKIEMENLIIMKYRV